MKNNPFISAIVLAAGTSTRMGQKNKLFLRIDRKTILRWSVENALKSTVNEVLVVTGEDINQVLLELKQLDVNVLMNRNYLLGMSSSIITGIRAVNPNSDAALILLADQPNLQADTIDQLIQTFLDSEKKIVVSRYDGIIGNPALFDRSLFPELKQIEGDVGARSVLKRHSDNIAVVDIPEEESLDVDTPQDFEKIRSLLQRAEFSTEIS
ncbi:nucleotidyltransferase family protein [candidate division KSB1 bacterium]|nr:nucleotidyltransferase family protein [candidate division KSB1 bacterium]NIR73069.1 nucleotidyltransferase family protein [candidate division KSB1 bacterium]NIS28310.1 nucleotidyltransferase family protein [candidate division KSB1 bacterium]NIT75179.1 nucleotidyltransferase family protein [candidate division KSB1 bacterium]NIU29016.1 nucleotidyltransferase family protein [candidate division KSB1 bacterium]